MTVDQKTESEIISRALLTIGVMPNKKGFAYLIDAITIYSHGAKDIQSVYAEISERYGVTSSSVDRCIRTSLGSLRVISTCEKINSLMNMPAIDASTTLTCRSFVALLAEYLRYQDMFRS